VFDRVSTDYTYTHDSSSDLWGAKNKLFRDHSTRESARCRPKGNIMNRFSNFVTLMMALGATTSAMAVGAKPNAPRTIPIATRTSPDGVNGKDQPRLAVFYSAGANIGQSVNVFEFTTPTTGVFCIQPIKKIKGVVFPVVSTEWSTSTALVFSTFWVDTSYYSDCPTGDYEVRTYDTSTPSAPVPTSGASFDFVIQ
jgi:hypothetical protein